MKSAVIIIGVAGVIGGVIIFMGGRSSVPSTSEVADVSNIAMVDGKQIVTINTKGGYSPTKSLAKAGVPTVLRFVTNGTFDCSSSIRIPSLSINKMLPQTGTTDIEVGTQTVATLQGTCGMGMYHFAVSFE